VVTGEQGMIGEIGIAQTSLSLAGKILVHGEIWDAVSSSEVAAGQRVVVRKIEGLQLQVDPVTTSDRVPSTVAP
jgi:membrane-bound serine protease (ClpP class)